MERLNIRVLRYFEIIGKDVCGLAAARIEEGDRVWQFPDHGLAFTSRAAEDNPKIRIPGRCYLFNMSNSNPGKRLTYALLSLDEARQREGLKQCYDLRISLSDMLTLGYSGINIDYIGAPARHDQQQNLPSRSDGTRQLDTIRWEQHRTRVRRQDIALDPELWVYLQRPAGIQRSKNITHRHVSEHARRSLW